MQDLEGVSVESLKVNQTPLAWQDSNSDNPLSEQQLTLSMLVEFSLESPLYMLCYGVIQGFQDILCTDVETPLLWFPPFVNILCQFVATPIPFTYTKTVCSLLLTFQSPPMPRWRVPSGAKPCKCGSNAVQFPFLRIKFLLESQILHCLIISITYVKILPIQLCCNCQYITSQLCFMKRSKVNGSHTSCMLYCSPAGYPV